jgi:peptidoglycan/xylan/chitin deacetylase (PgdA/CDA1 family)
MSGKKTLLSRAMSAVGLPPVVTRLRSLLRDEITVLAYHRVLDVEDEAGYPFDPELISASSGDFAWQMAYIRKHYTPITFARLLDCLDGKDRLPPRPIIVTFDDGFDDNYLNAFPVLEALGVPATIFVSTGYVDQPRTFWFDWLYYLYNMAAASSDESLNFADTSYSLSREPARRQEITAALYSHAKRLPDAVLRSEIAALEKRLGVSYPANGFARSRPLTWEQVREMASRGIEFGSHTVTHPILTNLGETQLREELAVSKARLEQETGRPVDVIAYPVGYEFAFNDNVIEEVRKAGYRLGACYLPGINKAKQMDLFRIRRLHVERYVDRSYFQSMLAFPEFFS